MSRWDTQQDLIVFLSAELAIWWKRSFKVVARWQGSWKLLVRVDELNLHQNNILQEENHSLQVQNHSLQHENDALVKQQVHFKSSCVISKNSMTFYKNTIPHHKRKGSYQKQLSSTSKKCPSTSAKSNGTPKKANDRLFKTTPKDQAEQKRCLWNFPELAQRTRINNSHWEM